MRVTLSSIIISISDLYLSLRTFIKNSKNHFWALRNRFCASFATFNWETIRPYFFITRSLGEGTLRQQSFSWVVNPIPSLEITEHFLDLLLKFQVLVFKLILKEVYLFFELSIQSNILITLLMSTALHRYRWGYHHWLFFLFLFVLNALLFTP